jgi:hypothetical protein
MSQQPVSLDGVMHKPGNPQAPRVTPPQSIRMHRTAPQQATQTTERPFYKPAPPAKRSRWQRWQMPLILTAGTIGGFLVQNEWIGIVMIAVYGLFALILRIPSRTTFALAALSIAAITVMLLAKPNEELATNFTTYTFLLLVVGVISLIIEGRPVKRRKRSRRLT